MKKCADDCPVACDFCIHYDFKGDERGVYTGDGYCNLHERREDPGSYCEEFRCNQAK